jgi:hypothetical protein
MNQDICIEWFAPVFTAGPFKLSDPVRKVVRRK